MGTAKNVRALGVVLAASGALVLGAGMFSANVNAASPATANLPVKLTIVAQCKVSTNGDLVFPDASLIENDLKASTSFTVRCTKNAQYSVSVLGGSNFNDTTKSRQMSNGTDRIAYSLYSDAALETAWDPSGSTEKTGNGTRTYDVHGLVRAQPSDVDYSTGLYQDTVQIRIDY
jgi:spore coat protein U-like protein